jgi:hypothetical protein
MKLAHENDAATHGACRADGTDETGDYLGKVALPIVGNDDKEKVPRRRGEPPTLRFQMWHVAFQINGLTEAGSV